MNVQTKGFRYLPRVEYITSLINFSSFPLLWNGWDESRTRGYIYTPTASRGVIVNVRVIGNNCFCDEVDLYELVWWNEFMDVACWM